MPTYSYRCTECDVAFDIHQAFTEDSLTVCPTCGGVLRKVFSPVGITFSGSGFYRTDSRADAKKASGPNSGSGSGSGSSGSGSGSKESSTAPAAKADKPAKAAPAASSTSSSSSASTS